MKKYRLKLIRIKNSGAETVVGNPKIVLWPFPPILSVSSYPLTNLRGLLHHQVGWNLMTPP